jgi:hypothetical protein
MSDFFDDLNEPIELPKPVPITKHKCSSMCSDGRSKYHDFEEVWDDFAMNVPQRELAYIESVRSRGRVQHERNLIRMFQSTLTGEYLIRMRATTEATQWMLGEIRFDSRDECEEYYNYCIELFGFTEVVPVKNEDFFESLEDKGDFFNDLSDDGGDFFGDLNKTDIRGVGLSKKKLKRLRRDLEKLFG